MRIFIRSKLSLPWRVLGFVYRMLRRLLSELVRPFRRRKIELDTARRPEPEQEELPFLPPLPKKTRNGKHPLHGSHFGTFSPVRGFGERRKP